MNRFSFSIFARNLFVIVTGFGLLASCTVDENGTIVMGPASVPEPEERLPDPNSKYYSPKNHIWVNDDIIDTVNSTNSRIEIDLSEQRARMYKIGGKKDVLAIETQVATGKSEYRTPTGSFKVMEKKAEKESNLYGKWIDNNTGKVLISDGDSREPPENADARFEGAPMPNWMRLTSGGVGLHIGYVPNYPASHGCIRVPRQIHPLIYSKSRIGTPVVIRQ